MFANVIDGCSPRSDVKSLCFAAMKLLIVAIVLSMQSLFDFVLVTSGFITSQSVMMVSGQAH